MTREATLPSWATALSPGKIEIDAEKFYPEILQALWADQDWPADKEDNLCKGLKRSAPDQYWLEVAYQCAKLDVQAAVSGTDLMPKKGSALLILVKDGSKTDDGISEWAQKAHSPGRGAKAATQGKEARRHYKRIRNILL